METLGERGGVKKVGDVRFLFSHPYCVRLISSVDINVICYQMESLLMKSEGAEK